MCWDILPQRIDIFIFPRFGIKLGWNKEVISTPWFSKVKMPPPHSPKSLWCCSLFHVRESISNGWRHWGIFCLSWEKLSRSAQNSQASWKHFSMLLEMLGSIIKFNHHNLPKIIGQHKVFQNCLILFSSIRIFWEWPKRLGRNENFKKPITSVGRFRNCPNVYSIRTFQSAKCLGRIGFFSTFLICPELWNCPNHFEHPKCPIFGAEWKKKSYVSSSCPNILHNLESPSILMVM